MKKSDGQRRRRRTEELGILGSGSSKFVSILFAQLSHFKRIIKKLTTNLTPTRRSNVLLYPILIGAVLPKKMCENFIGELFAAWWPHEICIS